MSFCKAWEGCISSVGVVFKVCNLSFCTELSVFFMHRCNLSCCNVGSAHQNSWQQLHPNLLHRSRTLDDPWSVFSTTLSRCYSLKTIQTASMWIYISTLYNYHGLNPVEWNKFQLLTVISCAAGSPCKATGRLCQCWESLHRSRCLW